MSVWTGEAVCEPAQPAAVEHIRPRPGTDATAPTGLNPSLAAAFAAVAALRDTVGEAGDAGPQRMADAAGPAALQQAAARLDDGIAILAGARRALGGSSPAAALAAAEAECRRLAADLGRCRPDRITDADAVVLPARPGFDRLVARLSATRDPSDRPTAMILVGIDRLARLDAEHGEGAGADVVAAVSGAMVTSFAGIGEVFRFDLDVFAAILPGLPLRQAVAVAEHLRRSMTGRRLVRRSTGTDLGPVTLSAGVVGASAGAAQAAAVDRAVRCLGEAQWHGGNRVVCETDPDFEQAVRAIA